MVEVPLPLIQLFLRLIIFSRYKSFTAVLMLPEYAMTILLFFFDKEQIIFVLVHIESQGHCKWYSRNCICFVHIESQGQCKCYSSFK